MLGPLGNGFAVPGREKKPILLAGGIGLGPILYLASCLEELSIPFLLVAGARTSGDLPSIPAAAATEIVYTTDDGSAGVQGTVIDALQAIPNRGQGVRVIYACGPRGMLKAAHEYATQNSLECYVSVEQVMGCGVGACMGCAVKTAGEDRYARACTEGPVFDSRMLAWD